VERERTAEKLKESESRNRAILQALPDKIFLLDERGTYLDWYANDPRTLYVPPEKFLGRTMREVMPPDVARQCQPALDQVLLTGDPTRVEYGLRINGENRYFETRIVRCRDRKLLSIARDITELKRAEIELQQLSEQLLNVQDDVSRRIARELHDTTAQQLFAITINLANLKRLESGLSEYGIDLVDECRDLCERSLREVRTLSYLSHAPEVEYSGLVSALRWYVTGFGKRTGIDVDFQVASTLHSLPDEMAVDLFRVAQEGLFNVFRYSRSQRASVVLESDGNHVVLQVKDSGSRIDPTARAQAARPVGSGISTVRERLRRWGGHLMIESSSDGALFTAQVPVPSQPKAAAGQ
jgi:PAS domain S-box-containing protein